MQKSINSEYTTPSKLDQRKRVSEEILEPRIPLSAPAKMVVTAIGICVFDMIILIFVWGVLGYQEFHQDLSSFLNQQVTNFNFYRSTFDLVCLSVARMFLLFFIYWSIRRSFGKFVKTMMFLVPLASIGYIIVKAIFIFLYIPHNLPNLEIALLATTFSLTFFFCFVEIIYAKKTLNREGEQVGFSYQQVGVEYDDDLDVDENETEEGKKDAIIQKKNKVTHANFKRVASLAIPEIPILMAGTIALLLSSAATLAMPAYFGMIIGAVATNHSYKELVDAIIGLLIISFVGSLFTFFRSWLFTLAGERLVARLRNTLFAVMTYQDISFFDKNRTGELTNRLASDTQVIQNAATVNISMFLRYVVQALGAFVILFLVSWKLTLVMISVVPLVVIVAVVYGSYIKKLRKMFQDYLAKANSVAEETLSSIRTVRSFSHERESQTQYAEKINDSYLIGRKISMAAGAFAGGIGLISQAAILLVLWYGGKLVIEGGMSAPSLIAFMLYTLTLAMAFAFISSLFGEFMQAIGAAERIFQLLDRVPKIPIEGGITLNKVEGSIKINNVSFAYPSRPKNKVLENIDIDLKPGKVVALVGRSGSGKSTIVGLIERFYDPIEGEVTLDGTNIKEFDPSWFRSNIGFVSQEPTLFACSIRDNITFGINEQISDEKIIEAAKKANAHEFIVNFDKGYDTLVGERGVRLSGGQKQRIAIARALIMDPKILLLDEATSALDSESEHLVHEALDNAMENRTVLVIAHRLSTVKNASEVVVMHKGSIAERGTHEELLKKGKHYYELVQRQLTKESSKETNKSNVESDQLIDLKEN